jgi:hypothetical protein
VAASWGMYGYFFDNSQPELRLTGIDDNGYYCADAQCAVASNKTGELCVWLDGKPLLSNFKIHSKNTDYPFTIPTRTIANGTHVLQMAFIDSSFRGNKITYDRSFYVDNLPLQAAFIKADGDYKVLQGRTLHLQFQVNKPIREAKVRVLARDYICFPENSGSLIYECFVPVACEENPNEYLFSIEMVDNVGNALSLDNKFQIVAYPFKNQHIAVGKEKFAQEKELGLPTNERERKIEELSKQSPAQKMWRGAFCVPIAAPRITCDYGAVRTTEEKGRYKHKALDLANAPKSMVWATHDGMVVLKDRFEDAGNTIIVDHGHGVLSLFYHLDDFAKVDVGQKIAQGNPIGTIGKTGYATGYHLHWEMRVNNVAIDPMQWTKSNF